MARTDYPESLIVAVALVAAAIAVLWPPAQLAHFLALVGGDIFHNIWTYERNIANLARWAPAAPSIMLPDEFSSLYGEFQPGNTAIYGLTRLLGASDSQGYALLYLLAFVLNGFFAYRIARLCGAPPLAGTASALLAGFAPVWTGQLEHVQLVSLYWVLAPVYFALRYLEDGRRVTLMIFAVCAVQLMCGPSYNLTIFVLTALSLAAFKFPAMRHDPVVRRRMAWLALCAVLAILPWSLIWFRYIQFLGSDAARDAAHNDLYRIDLAWLFVPSSLSALYPGQFGIYDRSHVPIAAYLASPGLAALTVFGLSVVWFRHGTPVVRALTLAAVLLLLLSFGSRLSWNGLYLAPNPAFILATKTPLLAATRNIGHLAFVSFAIMGIVVAWHLARYRVLAIALVVIAIAVESFTPLLPARLAGAAERPRPAVYDFLATLPRGSAVFLPFPRELGAGEPWKKQFEYMRYAHLHRLWLANGISGYFPASYYAAMKALAKFPSDEAVEWLAMVHMQYLIIDRNSPEIARVNADAIILRKLYEDADYIVFTR
ncbi:MAG: hypothetical protein E6G97_07880 [Alphaproteobacteria bacterium]|nr:MAG: hypothetical protein E6G97_07880 [Alphaproteobacteria bacterium]